MGSAQPALAQMPPDDTIKCLKAAAELRVSLFASEPMLTNPAAIDVDSLGRVWVAEIQWYRTKAKTPGRDKIKVLEDIDGDGRADKATVFADNVFAPMSICVAGDKVFVATSPNLWMYEDKNGDLVADGPPTKLLSGFGGENHDHGAHSLVLGPDHKWWMSHGDTGYKVTGTDGSLVGYQWGGVIRGELDGSQLENVAVNFRNPYEVCMSSFGEAFVSDNDNDGNQRRAFAGYSRGATMVGSAARRWRWERYTPACRLANIGISVGTFPVMCLPRWLPASDPLAACASMKATRSESSTRTPPYTPILVHARSASITTN